MANPENRGERGAESRGLAAHCPALYALCVTAAAVMLCALLPASASADWPIIMPPFENTDTEPDNGLGWLSVGLPDAARTKLHSVLLMRGITQDDILQAARKNPDVMNDAILAAQHFNSQLIVYGSYSITGEVLEISARCVDPVTGVDLATFTGRGPVHDPPQALDPILLEIARNVRMDLDREALDGIRAPLTGVADAFQSHARGLQELHVAISSSSGASGALDRAGKHFQEAVDLDPGYADPRFRLAEIDERRGNAKDAESGYRSALRADPLHADARYRLGALLSANDRKDEALTELELALKQAPEDPRVQSALSGLWFNQYSNSFADMEKQYKADIAADPNDIDAHFKLGSLYEELRRDEASRKELEWVVKKQPKHADANFKLGLLHQRAKRAEEAAKAFKAAIANGTTLARADYYLGDQLVRLGRDKEAIKSFKAATEREPNFSPAFFELAAAQSRLGMRSDALRTFQKYSELSERDPRPYVEVGRIYLAMTLYPQAKAAFEKAFAIDPDYADYHVGMGELYEQQGRTIKAAYEYGQAIQKDPSHPQAAELRAKIEKYKPAKAGGRR